MLTQDSTKTILPPLSPSSSRVQTVGHSPRRLYRNTSADGSVCVLNNRYQVGAVLGAGRQGVLYQARDLLLGRACTVKMPTAAAKDQPALELQYLHEAEVLTNLCHPNIAELRESNRDEQGVPFNVMECLRGRDLESLLAEVPVVPLERTLEILASVGAALQHAHDRGFVHLDLHPRCIFLDKSSGPIDDEVEVAKVLNFGLARRLGAERHQSTPDLQLGLAFASPAYLAPEALDLNSEAVDERADQWSLAVLAYQLLSGQLPFFAQEPWYLRALIRGAALPVPLAALNPNVPSHVVAAIDKALSKDKHQRFASVADFMRALDGFFAAASKRTKPELIPELSESCRPVGGLPTATPSALPATREYPAISFPSALLASAECDLAPQPEPMLTPIWTGAQITQKRPGAIRALWLMGCIVMALIPALTAWHFLHSPVRTKAVFHRVPSQPAPRSAAPVAIARAETGVSPQLPPPPTNSVRYFAVHKHQPAPSHRGRTHASTKPAHEHLYRDTNRRPSSQKSAQDILQSGLGL